METKTSNKGKGKLHNSYKHGLSYMKEYYIFNTIRARCYSVNDHNYKYYGARGITIWAEWLLNPKMFIDYVKSLPCYGVKNYSLDRIDNNGNYEPGNIRWTTKSMQVVNRNPRIKKISGLTLISFIASKNKWRISLTINGKKKHIGYAKESEEAIRKRDTYILLNKPKGYVLERFGDLIKKM